MARTIALIYIEEHAIPNYIRKMILTRLIWAVTENDDDGNWKKYNGQPFWSEGALKKVISNLENGNPFWKDLRHEHSIPKKIIISQINNSNKSEEEVYKILDKLGHSTIVSKEEDSQLSKKGLRSTMPSLINKGLNEIDIFSRYREIGIRIYDIGKKDILTIDTKFLETLNQKV